MDFFWGGEGLFTVGGREGFLGFSSSVLFDVTSGAGVDFIKGSFTAGSVSVLSSSICFSITASGGGVAFFRCGEELSVFSSSSVDIVASGTGVPFFEGLSLFGDLSTCSGLSSSASFNVEAGVDLFPDEGLFTGGGLEGFSAFLLSVSFDLVALGDGEDFIEGCFTGAGLRGFTSSLGIVASGAEECG